MISNIEDSSLPEDDNSTENSNSDNTTNYGAAEGSGSLGDAEADQQVTSENDDMEDEEVVTDDDEKDTTMQAGEIASGSGGQKLAMDRRNVGSAPARANEATDRNDSGSGGLSAGGAKSASSLQ